MIKTFVDQITHLKSIKKVFMDKRDVMVYDKSWDNIAEQCTEYNVEIITNMIEPGEWRKIVAIEKQFDEKYPQFKFYYNVIESESDTTNSYPIVNGKLIYDSKFPIESDFKQHLI